MRLDFDWDFTKSTGPQLSALLQPYGPRSQSWSSHYSPGGLELETTPAYHGINLLVGTVRIADSTEVVLSGTMLEPPTTSESWWGIGFGYTSGASILAFQVSNAGSYRLIRIDSAGAVTTLIPPTNHPLITKAIGTRAGLAIRVIGHQLLLGFKGKVLDMVTVPDQLTGGLLLTTAGPANGKNPRVLFQRLGGGAFVELVR